MTLVLIGPVCEDLIVIGDEESSKVGGASFYQSFVYEEFFKDYMAIANASNADLISEFPNESKARLVLKEDTHYFVNEYPDKDNLDIRNQSTNFANIPITEEDLNAIFDELKLNEDNIDAFVLNPLNRNDFPIETIDYLSSFDVPIYISLQGFLRFKGEDDSIVLKLTNGCVKDTIGGIDLTELKSDITICGKRLIFSNAVVQQVTTRLDIPKAEFLLPDKKKGTSLSFHADSIKGRVMLKDISQPFAPVLRKFSIPLNLSVDVSGTNEGLLFKDIQVGTDDKKLTISAMGMLRNLREARKLALHFEVYEMKAKPGIKHKIINQFTVKKYMMTQIYAMGLIRYAGSFDILWKKQQFRGLLNTEKGDVHFNFELDGVNKYVTGNVSTDSLKLGELFQLEKIGNIDCSASFKIDISKSRTGVMRKQKGGKLPMGEVKADIRKIGYRGINMKNIVADIQSDGAIANGDVTLMGNLTDLVLQFSFTNTDEMHKMKIKPRLQFGRGKDKKEKGK